MTASRHSIDVHVTYGFLVEPLYTLGTKPRYYATFNEYLDSMRLPSAYLGQSEIIAAITSTQ